MIKEISEIEFSEWVDSCRPNHTIVRGELLVEICVPDEAGEKEIAAAKEEILRALQKCR